MADLRDIVALWPLPCTPCGREVEHGRNTAAGLVAGGAPVLCNGESGPVRGAPPGAGADAGRVGGDRGSRRRVAPSPPPGSPGGGGAHRGGRPLRERARRRNGTAGAPLAGGGAGGGLLRLGGERRSQGKGPPPGRWSGGGRIALRAGAR